MIIKDLYIIRSEIENVINDLNLNLKGLVVLTEAASGLFAFTPIIALMAGAKKVVAVSQTTKFGSFDDIKRETLEVVNFFGADEADIEIVLKNEYDRYNEIDIVTNSGHVRPINERLISTLKKTAVISYMSEPWEYRNDDLDLYLCNKKGILVYGTNEDHPLVNCFIETGHIAMKMIYESKISVINAKIAIVSRDKFGKTICHHLLTFTDKVILIDDFENIPEDYLTDLDILIVADYLYDKEIISGNGIIKPQDLIMRSPHVKIIQFCGNNNMDDLKEQGISCYPAGELEKSRMFYTLADISYRSAIRLFAAGLKVGEGLQKPEMQSMNGSERKKIMESGYPALAFDNPIFW